MKICKFIFLETKMLRGFFSVLVLFILTSVKAYAQDDQSGFISIDCGIAKGSSYTDNITGINYVSDIEFIDSGESHGILPIYETSILDSQLTKLTSFPQNNRSCYTLKPTQGKGNRYLIRARFMYGNYDFRGQLPQFDLYLGPDYWDTIRFNSSSRPVNVEIIHVSSSDYVYVCLVNTGHGTPFVSAIELRLLDKNMYKQTEFGSLALFARVNFGPSFGTARYRSDKYDRLWTPMRLRNSTYVYTLDEVKSGLFTTIEPPLSVMSNANVPANPTDSLSMWWEPKWELVVWAFFSSQSLDNYHLKHGT